MLCLDAARTDDDDDDTESLCMGRDDETMDNLSTRDVLIDVGTNDSMFMMRIANERSTAICLCDDRLMVDASRTRFGRSERNRAADGLAAAATTCEDSRRATPLDVQLRSREGAVRHWINDELCVSSRLEERK